MKMDQMKFIWLANQVHPEGGVTQDETSVVVMNLRPQIQVTHDYKKQDRIEIIFRDDNTRFFVEDHNALQEVFSIHLSNKDCVQLIREYAEKHFKKCE